MAFLVAQIVLCLPHPLIGCAQARRAWFRSFMVLLHPLRDGCLRLQLCPFCGSEAIPRFFDSKRPVLYQQHGALCCQKVFLFDKGVCSLLRA